MDIFLDTTLLIQMLNFKCCPKYNAHTRVEPWLALPVLFDIHHHVEGRQEEVGEAGGYQHERD
jgi:hypothetical protein